MPCNFQLVLIHLISAYIEVNSRAKSLPDYDLALLYFPLTSPFTEYGARYNRHNGLHGSRVGGGCSSDWVSSELIFSLINADLHPDPVMSLERMSLNGASRGSRKRRNKKRKILKSPLALNNRTSRRKSVRRLYRLPARKCKTTKSQRRERRAEYRQGQLSRQDMHP